MDSSGVALVHRDNADDDDDEVDDNDDNIVDLYNADKGDIWGSSEEASWLFLWTDFGILHSLQAGAEKN